MIDTIPNLAKLGINPLLPQGPGVRSVGLQQAVAFAQREADPRIQPLWAKVQLAAASQLVGHALLDQRPAQAAPVPKPLLVTRTTQVPPDCASTRNSDLSGLSASGSLPMRAAQSSS